MVLTPKQRQILELVRTGMTVPKVSEKVNMEEGAIYRTIQKLRNKYDCANTAALINLFHEEGIFSYPNRQIKVDGPTNFK